MRHTGPDGSTPAWNPVWARLSRYGHDNIESATRFTTSADGTRIAYQVDGTGSPLVLVDGGLAYREQGLSPGLRKILQDRFAVYSLTGATVERAIREQPPLRGARGRRPRCGHRDLRCPCGRFRALRWSCPGAGGRPQRLLRAADGASTRHRSFSTQATLPTTPTLPGTSKSSSTTGAAVRLWAWFFRLMEGPAPVRLLVRVLPLWKKLTAVAHTLPYDLQSLPRSAAYSSAPRLLRLGRC